MANATTPLAFLPIPRSSILGVEEKKSVLEKRREEERERESVEEEVSKPTQNMRSECTSALKSLLLCTN
jgi:hypothetical protein